MANFTTSADLLERILSRAGEPTDATSDVYDDALAFLNRAYQGMWSGGSELDPLINETWWWLRKDSQGVVTMNPRIEDGSVLVTNGSASITFSSAPTPSVAGRHFKINDHGDVFIISSHTAGEVGATLESVYTGETNAAASYRIFQLDYTLASDLLYLSAPMYAYRDAQQEIELIDLYKMKHKWSVEDLHSGVPRNFAMLSNNKVRFSHSGGATSTELIKIDYEYAAEPADLADDANEPICPRQYRPVLVDWALMYLHDLKEDTRAANAAAMARNGMAAMQREHRRRMVLGSDRFGKVEPRQAEVYYYHGLIRTESGLIVG